MIYCLTLVISLTHRVQSSVLLVDHAIRHEFHPHNARQHEYDDARGCVSGSIHGEHIDLDTTDLDWYWSSG
jgi:hypothetical protein